MAFGFGVTEAEFVVDFLTIDQVLAGELHEVLLKNIEIFLTESLLYKVCRPILLSAAQNQAPLRLKSCSRKPSAYKVPKYATIAALIKAASRRPRSSELAVSQN